MKRLRTRPTWQARLLNNIDPRTDLPILAVVVLLIVLALLDR